MKEGTLQKMCRRGLEPRAVFLFNDTLVYGQKALTGGLTAQSVMPLCKAALVRDVADAKARGGPDVVFQVNTPTKSFQLHAASPAEKAEWVAALDAAIAQVRSRVMGKWGPAC